ncbi:MAG: hypothetical protein LUH51_08435 [Firmicutes bacterium]|nr:hypothetical protein [Bacillota bacterium]
MKKWIPVAMCALLLCGCAPQSWETVTDVYEPVTLTSAEATVALPEDACVLTLSSDEGTLYLCQGYEIALLTLPGGNLDATVREVTGYSLSDLAAVQTARGSAQCTQCAFSCQSEDGDTVGRLTVLDDGLFHYCLCLTALAGDTGALQATWQAISDSFAIGSAA